MDFYIKVLFWKREVLFFVVLEYDLNHFVECGLENKLENVALQEFSVKLNFILL